MTLSWANEPFKAVKGHTTQGEGTTGRKAPRCGRAGARGPQQEDQHSGGLVWGGQGPARELRWNTGAGQGGSFY